MTVLVLIDYGRNPLSATLNTADPHAIRDQLERVLQSAAFRNSQRYTAFLKYCVEQTLAGQGDVLKERTIGVEVFGRVADYDTAADHIVRSAASEVRKRLAQYYQEPGKARELKIEMLSGSYVPQFRVPEAAHASEEVRPVAEAPKPRRVSGGRLLSAVAVVAALAGLFFQFVSRESALDQFWGPVLASKSPVLLCVGDRLAAGGEAPEAAGSATVSELHTRNTNRVSFAAATTMARLTGLLQSRGIPYRLRTGAETTFGDLQSGPTVLIGGYNNDWTLRLTDTLRFGFDGLPDHWPRIRDRNRPERQGWSVDFSLPVAKLNRDYAIVSRVQDPKTERVTVIVAGIGMWGTKAAGEFLTDAAHMEKLRAVAPAGWETMNLQVVISTDVIQGVAGPPKVLDTHFWQATP